MEEIIIMLVVIVPLILFFIVFVVYPVYHMILSEVKDILHEYKNDSNHRR